jgi:hypothetical protein
MNSDVSGDGQYNIQHCAVSRQRNIVLSLDYEAPAGADADAAACKALNKAFMFFVPTNDVRTSFGLWDFHAHNQCSSSFYEHRTNDQLRLAGWSEEKILHFRPTNTHKRKMGVSEADFASANPTNAHKRKMGVSEADIASAHPGGSPETILRAHNDPDR